MSKTPKHKKSFSTGYLLWQAGNAWQRNIKSALDPVGITHVQFLLLDSLEQLSALKHPVTQVTLSKVAGTDVMMTSKVIRLLEKKKLVSRKSAKIDGRVFLLELTRDGSRTLVKARTLVENSEKKFFSTIKSKHDKFANCLVQIASVDF